MCVCIYIYVHIYIYNIYVYIYISMYIDRYGFECRFKYGDNLGYRYHLNNGRYGSKAAEVPTQREESGSWWLKRRPLKTGGVYHFFNGKITGT